MHIRDRSAVAIENHASVQCTLGVMATSCPSLCLDFQCMVEILKRNKNPILYKLLVM